MKKKRDLVVCLSHLGYKYSGNTVPDQILTKESAYFDQILEVRTHTFLDAPVEFMNKKGHLVIVNQADWGGIRLGSLDIMVSRCGMLANPRNTMLKVS